MKKIKTVFIIILSILLIVPCFQNPIDVEASTKANTLKELRKELADYKAKKAAADSNKNRTQNQITTDENQIKASQTQIENNKAKIEKAKEDIKQLDKEIEETTQKINSLMRAYEVSKGDNKYLEYIFGATSISDLIIRFSMSEQITKYNDELIDEYENKIRENEQLQIDLKNKEVELNNQISNLESQIEKLGNNLKNFIEDARDASEEIKAIEGLIQTYVNMGCKEDENLDACAAVKGDTGFLRPLTKGTITSYYGYRTHPVTGVKNKLHTGIDIGGNAEGTNVYSTANGSVGMIVRESSCGGNIVYVYHTVKGVQYTSVYMHLYKINVSVGQAVTNQTVIGTVGGGSKAKSVSKTKDTCSTGPHLHFGLAKGWYGRTYTSYNTYVSKLVNPRDVISFPNMGSYFYSR